MTAPERYRPGVAGTHTPCESDNCGQRGSQVVILGKRPLWLCRDCAEYVLALPDQPQPRRSGWRGWLWGWT